MTSMQGAAPGRGPGRRTASRAALNSPPRSQGGPAACGICAAPSVCRGLATAQGPVTSVKVVGPIGTRRPRRPTRTVERWRVGWRLTSLYGAEIAPRRDARQRPQVQRVEPVDVTDQPDDVARGNAVVAWRG